MKNVSLLLRALQLLCLGGCAAFVLCAVPAHAAQPPAAKKEKKFVPYKITRGDTLSVVILGEGDLTASQKRVEATGTISLPLIQDIRLYGLTINEAQEAIAKAYRDGRFLRNPIVTVTMEGYAPRTVIVSGKVNAQGKQQIPADTEITILEVISNAGGLGETAKGTAVKVTRTMPDGTLKVFILDVESALRGKNNSTSGDATFVLQPDDIIYVPEKMI